MNKRRMLAIFLTLCMAIALLAGCGGGGGKDDSAATPPAGEAASPPAASEVKYADLIDILLPDAVTTPDPHHTGGAGSGHRAVFKCIFDRLVERAPSGDFVGRLASSWSTDDLKTWTFNLRNDVKFHNGQQFTAQDVINTVVSAQNSPGASGYNMWREVDTITAKDDYTIEIVLGDVNADFLFFISDPAASIINKAARDADPVTGAYEGTGAFYVSDFVSGEYMTLTRNDDYWGEAPKTRQLNFRWVPEMTARAIMMENMESDFAWVLNAEDLPPFEKDTVNFTIYRFIENAAFTLAFNMNDPITGDLNFRMAVAHAMYLPDVGMAAEGDKAVIQQDGTFWGYSTEFRNTDIPILAFDQDLAKEYLAKSNYNGEEVEIMAALPPNIKASEMMAEQLSAVGINTTLFITDIANLNTVAIYGNTVTQMVTTVSPFGSYASSAKNFLSPEGGGNRSNYSNPEVNRLFDLGPTIVDRGEREKVYKEIQELVHADLPKINHFHLTFPMVATSALQGFVIDPDQNHDFRYIYKIVE